jgi:hypothetical protein
MISYSTGLSPSTPHLPFNVCTCRSKYLRNKRIGDYELKVEQAEFAEMSMEAREGALVVGIDQWRSGQRVQK